METGPPSNPSTGNVTAHPRCAEPARRATARNGWAEVQPAWRRGPKTCIRPRARNRPDPGVPGPALRTSAPSRSCTSARLGRCSCCRHRRCSSLCSLAPFRPASLTVRAPPPHQDSPLTATRRVRPCQEIHQVAQPTFSTPACDSRQLPGNHRGIDANTSFLTYGSPLGDAAMSRLQPAIALSCQWVIFTTVAFCKEVQADGKRTAGNRLPRC